jgi:HYR domain-containing protein
VSGSTFALGDTTVVCSAHDSRGNTASGSFTVSVHDTTPPTAPALTITPSSLWPANHKLVPVSVTASSVDSVSGGAACTIVDVTSNEPDNGLGDGDTAGDIVRSGGLTLSLRAERSGAGDGRIYTLSVACVDKAGNRSGASLITVAVPHDR